MSDSKIAKTFRLSGATVRQLEYLSKQYGISQAAMIAVMVHCKYNGYDYDEWDNYLTLAKEV